MSKAVMSWEEAVLHLRNQPDSDVLIANCFYDDPVSAAAARYHASSEWLAVRAELPACKGRALDLGAGRGISSYALAKDGWDVTALEPDFSNLVGSGAIRELAAATGVSIEVCTTWGESLPFPDASFDLVYCRAVLHHARDLRSFCAEAFRVLKPGGRLVATREHVVSNEKELAAFLAAHPLHSFYGGEHAYRLSEYREMIKRTGFSIRRVLGPYQSEINTFPESRADIVERLRNRVPFPMRALPGSLLLALYGALIKVPGRLYSFIAVRP